MVKYWQAEIGYSIVSLAPISLKILQTKMHGLGPIELMYGCENYFNAGENGTEISRFIRNIQTGIR
jgi:hypothetical protein